MRSHITVSYTTADDGVWLYCHRHGCGWTHNAGSGGGDGPTIEELSDIAADHWITHLVADTGRVWRETVDDLRTRVGQIVGEHQSDDRTPQVPVSEPPETVGDDAAADLAERLQTAHRAVWHCADCGSSTMVGQSDGSLRCVGCGRVREIDAGMLAAGHSRYAADHQKRLDDAGFPEPDDVPTTGAPKLDDAGFPDGSVAAEHARRIAEQHRREQIESD